MEEKKLVESVKVSGIVNVGVHWRPDRAIGLKSPVTPKYETKVTKLAQNGTLYLYCITRSAHRNHEDKRV
jgi:hypothetical protein